MTTTPTKPPEKLLQSLRRGHRFLITSHTHPDGDAIGSSLGLARALRSLGKSALIWLRDEIPSFYGEFPGAGRIHTGTTPPAGFPENFSAAIVLECPTLDRTGLEEVLEKALPLINIDHHLGNSLYGQSHWVEPSAPAVGELVKRLAEALHATLDGDTSDLLLAALSSDTGGFRFSNATEQAFQAAADLVRTGAQPARVSQWLYESYPPSRIALLGRMLETFELHHEGTIATVRLSEEMFAKSGAAPGDAEGLVDVPRSIAGVEAVALFREIGKDTYKVSLRSRGAVDVETIARQYDGGGHHNAAGCRLEQPFATATQTIVEALAGALAPKA
jgi:phosphoesterase RecJ-like protein